MLPRLSAFFLLFPVCLSLALEQGEFLGAAPVEHPSWFKTSFLDIEEDLAEARAADKRLIIYFYQNGCPYCSKLIRENFSNQQLLRQLHANFDLIAINMWGDREVMDQDGQVLTEKQYADKNRVQFTPTLVFFDLDGSQKIRINGYRSVEKFMAVMGYVADENSAGQRFADYAAASKDEATKQAMPSAPFFSPPPHALARTPIPARRPLAVFFETSNCSDCLAYHAGALARPEVISRLKKMDVAQLDVKGKVPVLTPDARRLTARQWARELDVTYMPSIVFFDQTGNEVFRTNGMLKAFHTQAVLEYVLTQSYKTEPSFQRFIEHYADQIRATGVDVDIWAD